MDIVVAILAVLTGAAVLTALFLFKTLKQTKASLQEFLLESETQKQNPKIEVGDIYFKIDNSFNITFIEEKGANLLGFSPELLVGKPVLGNLMEENDATVAFLKETFNKISKKQTTFNTQMLIQRQDHKTMLMLTRIRPILNEILKTKGLSFLCKDISKADELKKQLSNIQDLDPFTDILNEKTLKKRFDHDFNLANRYNKELSAVVVELKDMYDFIAKGIDFETADKMLKNISSISIKFLPADCYAGRVDKTKIVLVLKNYSREKALQIAIDLFERSVTAIRELRVDYANAQMIVVSYSNRKGFTDSFDAMMARIERHINMALKQKEYGIVSSDTRRPVVVDLENIKS